MTVIALKHTRPTNRRDPGALLAKALDRHAQIEQKLARTMNAWQKSRAMIKRIEKRIDEAQVERWEADQAFIDDPI